MLDKIFSAIKKVGHKRILNGITIPLRNKGFSGNFVQKSALQIAGGGKGHNAHNNVLFFTYLNQAVCQVQWP